MKKFKKIAIGALLAASAGCLAGAAAGCQGEPNYYTLTFDGKGVDYVFQGDLAPEDGSQFVSGYSVKDGVEVRFTLALADNSVGTPVVKLNGAELTPNEDGVYSFIMGENSSVTVDGLQEKKKVTFSTGDWFSFIDEQGNKLEDLTVVKGEDVKFKVWVSPYMKQNYTITNDTEELECDTNGYYTISSVVDNSTVNINGLEQDDSFVERGDGTGTESDPFLIKRPIDMYMVAGLINNTFNSGAYSAAYYKLESDIDMQGEKLFVIGDTSSANAIFCGTFDGNGHKVSNFKLTDEVVDQESYANEYLSFVGLFGYACATRTAPAVIKNLTLENGTLEIHPESITSSETASYAGLLVGYGVGVQVEGCNVVGSKVTSYNNNSRLSFIGGVVGVLQSAYNESLGSTLTYDSYVNGCNVNVEVGGRGAIRAAGGVVGILSTADTGAISYVSNCVTSGSVSGAMLTGGIVGNISRFSSIANCYSSAAITASNSITSNGTAAAYRCAYAGGIVGYAENDTVISSCYAANTSIKASAASKIEGKGDIVGFCDADLVEAADSKQCVLINNAVKDAAHTTAIFTEQLGWAASEWNFEGATPVYSGATALREVTITVKKGDDTVASYKKKIVLPVPTYVWYDEQMGEYVQGTSGRSWGYYFDKELTQKVPYGYLPAADCVMYVGYANYADVAGKYYIGKTSYGVNANITLDEDGTYFFRDGGMSFKGNYSYDGNTVILYNSCLGTLEYETQRLNGAYATVVMKKTDSGYSITGKMNVLTSDYTSNESVNLSFTATKYTEDFAYGEYSNGDGTLILKENGSGSYTVGNSVKSFTFTVTENAIINTLNLPIVVENGVVVRFVGKAASLKDNFSGVWKTSTGSSIAYSFDGFGVVTCGGVTGTYEPSTDGSAIITLNGVEHLAVMAEDALYIDGVAYYVSDGFTGEWFGTTSSGESIELSLGGIGKNGYGEADIIFYSGVTHTAHGEYSVTDSGVMQLYVGDTIYAELAINKNGSAVGVFFSFKAYSTLSTITYVDAEFKLYDLFKGVWECNLNGVRNINFTGKTAGAQKATALVTSENGQVTAAEYTATSSTEGSITINGVTYTMTLDEATNKIELVGGNAGGELAQRDAWYGVTLYDEDGVSYKFDGKGNIGGCVTSSTGTLRIYYMQDGMPLIDGIPLVSTGNGFTWDDKTLTFKTGFASTWLLPESNEQLVISEVKNDFTATVVMDGKTYEYNYNPERNTLSYSYTAASGVTTVTIAVLSENEISVVYKGVTEDSHICIADGKLDAWAGEYSAEDGSSWTFDGHGLGEYGRGTAVYLSANGKKTTYSYVQNDINLIYIYTGGKSGMLFAEVAEGGFKKAGATTAYSPVAVDDTYLLELRFNGEYVLLDGIGNILSGTTKTGYTYKTVSSRYLVVTDSNGNKSVGTITTSGAIKDLALSTYEEWTNTADQVNKYVFIGTSIYAYNGNSYSWKYGYEELEGEYYLTDSEGNVFLMTLNKNNKTFVLEEINDENKG